MSVVRSVAFQEGILCLSPKRGGGGGGWSRADMAARGTGVNGHGEIAGIAQGGARIDGM